ncbi:hypothetical protein [Massilia atriviolacea]|uniref:hypothetical protein n=1 Tax=Massilia atriviolacea TaxID=2495579 RepID=UPI001E32FFC4|nr:hypothetical protein [Massilia atriviolacea]
MLLLAMVAFVAGGAALYHHHHEANLAPAAVKPPAASQPAQLARTKAQAIDALMALPELKAWSAHIEKASAGKARGALLDDQDSAPRRIGGKSYWSLSFVENSDAAAHRWESFLVATTGDEILVDDTNDDRQLTLDQWRAEKRPMERIAKQDDSAPTEAAAPK